MENSCGEGNILIKVARRYIEAAKQLKYSNKKIKSDLEKYILGFEIDKRTMERCIINLDLEASQHGIKGVKWNIKNANYLRSTVNENIDYIIGNPPYIMYQNLNDDERNYLKQNFLSCSKGKFDYCYAFIEKSIKELSSTGRMAYIIPNSIFKNVFGKELRGIMKFSLEEIYDYKESVVFNNVITSPAIIILNKNNKVSSLTYHDIDNRKQYEIKKKLLGDSKWLFTQQKSYKNSISSPKFSDFFKVSNSVATLLNSAFIINQKDILFENEKYIELKEHRIEKEILRSAARPRNYSINRGEYIIFPYSYVSGNLQRFNEASFKENYPGAYNYLLRHLDKLNSRASDKSAKWFEYGRSQALSHLNQEKILLSSVVTNEIKLYRIDENTIPYSGFYIIAVAEKSLNEAEEILRSKEFFSYLSVRGINANGRSLRLSVNDIMNYSLS